MSVRNWALGAVAALMLVICGPMGQARAQCARAGMPAPMVQLSVSIPIVKYRHDVDLLGLPKIRARSVETVPTVKGKLLGLTVYGEGYRYKVQGRSWRSADGRYCHWLTRVDAELEMPEMTVYVAANYPIGTCEYNVILEHENTHVRITRGVIAQFAPRFDTELRGAVARINPVLSPQANLNDVKGFLDQALKPFMQQLVGETARGNGVIDTPESYRASAARCQHW
jgi:hypothetical protein